MARSKPTKPKPKPKVNAKAKAPSLLDIKLSPVKRAQLERIHALGVLNKKPTAAPQAPNKGVNLTGEANRRPATKDF